MNSNNDLKKKMEYLRKIYKDSNKNGLLIVKQNNLAWLLGGRTHVSLASVDGVVELLLNDDGLYMVANNIEAERIHIEEFNEDITIKEYPWYEDKKRKDIIKELVNDNYLIDSEVEGEIKKLRIILTENERNTFKELGKDVAEIMEDICFNISPGMTEQTIASFIMQKCMDRGIDPTVTLVAADERIFLYRHPLPTTNVVKDYVMIVIAGRRNGQYVGLTRFVSFKDLTLDLIRKRDSVLRLYASLLLETRPGKNVKDVFSILIDGYKKEGFENEWTLHHQGGLTGYNTREVKITHDTNLIVEIGQTYAWNPSITGCKAEDTFIVEKEDNHIITNTINLPYTSINYSGKNVKLPDILIRKQYV